MVSSNDTSVRTTRRLATAAWIALPAGVFAFQQGAHQLPFWAQLVGLLLLLVGGVWAAPAIVSIAETEQGRWRMLAIPALLGGLYVRLQYIDTVPAGWGAEALTFLRFARHLVESGFPYEPYSWYAHTLLSYIVAVVMLVVPSDLMAFRLGQALISISTLVVVLVLARRLLGWRAATLAAGVLAASCWHLFASRNGYHQQLLPLCQGLVVLGLAEGVVERKYRGFILAAAGMVLGLHAHWGFYLMPGYCVVVGIYLYFFHPEHWRQSSRGLATAGLVAVVWTAPLFLFFWMNSQTVNYVLNGLTAHASQAADLASKLAGNASYIAWALSGNAAAPVEFGSRVDPLVGCAAFVGLCLTLRRFVSHIGAAFLLILLLVNVGGMTIALANVFYITATLVAVYLLAAVGIESWMSEVGTIVPRAKPLLVALVVSVVAWQGVQNDREFFGRRIFSELRDAQHPPGSAFLLLDRIRERMDRQAVFVARDEPGRDFDTAWIDLGQEVPSYSFVKQTRPYNASMVLFPRAATGGGHGVDIWLPNVPYATDRQIPLLRRFYPSATLDQVDAPPPYAESSPGPVAYRVGLNAEDVAAYQGLRNGAGYLVAPADGRYFLRATRQDAHLWLQGVEVALVVDDSNPSSLFLEEGMHPLRSAAEIDGVEWQVGNSEWQPLADVVVNAGERPTTELAPFVARLGRLADFHYQQRLTLPPPAEIRAVEIEEDGSFVSMSRTAIRWHEPGGGVVAQLSIPSGEPLLLAHTTLGLLRVDSDGTCWTVERDRFESQGRVDCAPAEILAHEESTAVLCHDGQVIPLPSDNPRTVPPSRLAGWERVSEAAAMSDDIVVTDGYDGRLGQLDHSGSLRHERVLPGLELASEVEGDAFGNLFVSSWNHGMRAYDGNGTLLFEPSTGRPGLFLRAPGLETNTQPLHRLRFYGDHAIALGTFGMIFTFQRIVD